ncbi:SgcJ/EcaC family oxidoreductase [Jiangella ureilytica]|uniref:SgcJ/EcaC family oxidoreductase n=1 Tax=Jiangella ureilytica TaxID=2530374 RepID=A0A4R4RU02_9ACTN|nr:nuclear transport factor 2 family protein [Jiangella ureilytica]TDC53551.1 SgcJ/EcaC family oxidoreductase [Jiangella ureilytica]
MNDTTAETEIRSLIERWAAAAQTGDLDGIVAGHTADTVMFDVSPPAGGVRGLQAYRDSWGPFLDMSATATAFVFRVTSIEVTAGADVAFAHALLDIGPASALGQDSSPLRLSVGLRKQDGRWLIAHEHHSFARS